MFDHYCWFLFVLVAIDHHEYFLDVGWTHFIYMLYTFRMYLHVDVFFTSMHESQDQVLLDSKVAQKKVPEGFTDTIITGV